MNGLDRILKRPIYAKFAKISYGKIERNDLSQRLQNGNGLNRKTLRKIPYYPDPKELYSKLTKSPGWPYKTHQESYLRRDLALASVTYLIGGRISEILRLKKNQFIDRDSYIEVRMVELSKSRRLGKQRKDQYREGRLPKKGERKPLTELVLDYIEDMDEEKRLFKFKPQRAWQIVTALLPEYTIHWLRAFCEDYLYGEWNNDLLAVADYVKVDARTLQEYIRRRYQKYPTV